MSIQERKKAPAFTLADDEGRPVSLADYKGKNVVLYFYPKDDTPGCTTEACSFRDELKDFGAQNTVILGVSPDSSASHKKFKAKYGLNFPLLSDSDKKVLEAYGVWKEKSMYGRKYIGVERTTFIIDRKGILQKIFPKVSISGHTQAILEALRLISSQS